MKFSQIEPLEARIAPASLSIADVKITEGDNGTKTATITATLDEMATSDVTFTLSTQNGTAVAGTDYVAKTESKTIATGETTATFDVTINGDRAFEATESFFVNLTDATGATVTETNPINPAAQATARVYLYNDDTQNLGPRKAQWIDVDGDLVTMTVTKGLLPLDNTTLFTFVDAGTVGGQILQKLNFNAFRGSFAGTSVSITATKQPGFPDASDGRVDVGLIQAATFIPAELQVIGMDLGTVTIDGDLAQISAGDQFSTAAIAKLDVYSLGMKTSSLPADPNATSTTLRTQSDVLGPIGTLNVKMDVGGFLHVVGAEFGTIGTIKIGGDLKGGAPVNSGRITASGRILNATIGNIVGGSGNASGFLSGTPETGGKLGNVTVLGNVQGGTGANSGEIFSTGTIGAIKIGGKLIGAGGIDSGSIQSGGNVASLSVGALVGGTAQGSGSVRVGVDNTGASNALAANIGAVIVTGKDAANDSLKGSTGLNSGRLDVLGNVASFTAAGNVHGGTGSGSGAIGAGGYIGKVAIAGSLIGADNTTADALNTSGAIKASWLKSVAITGDIIAGKKLGAGTITNSGAILANRIDLLTVGGKLTGDATNPVFINATGLLGDLAIKSITVNGAVEFAEIRAGYSDTAATSADASIGAVVFGDTVHALDLVAGAQPGPDGRFGTVDDVVATGVKNNAAIFSKIASVLFKNAQGIITDPLNYGIAAQHVAAITLGAAKIPLLLGPGNDRTPIPIPVGGTTNFRVVELPIP